ncbi:MAG: ribbon-helix-helix domain-containing protein [Burkholderiales bacterium]
MSDSVRWTVKVSSETDRLLRSFLGAQGMKKGDLSRFVEEAVRWRVLDETVRTIRERNRDLPAEALQDEIDRAVREVRNEFQTAAD